MASRLFTGAAASRLRQPSDRIADPVANIAMPALIHGECGIGFLRRETDPRDAQERFHTVWVVIRLMYTDGVRLRRR